MQAAILAGSSPDHDRSGTNLLVRDLAQDDESQSPLATRLIESFTPKAPGYVSQVVLVETVWVLKRAYKMPREAVAGIVEGLLRSREILIDRAEAAYRALAVFRASKADFADALIAQSGRLTGCEATLTFEGFAASDVGMRLLDST